MVYNNVEDLSLHVINVISDVEDRLRRKYGYIVCKKCDNLCKRTTRMTSKSTIYPTKPTDDSKWFKIFENYLAVSRC